MGPDMSTRGASAYASTTPLVPIETSASPGCTTPLPTAPQALSAPPPATGVPATRSVRAATSSVMVPHTASAATTGGSKEGSRSIALSTSRDHTPCFTSKRQVPAASEISIANVVFGQQHDRGAVKYSRFIVAYPQQFGSRETG